MRAAAYLFLVGCASAPAEDAFRATFEATRLGSPEETRVVVLPRGAVLALESDSVVAVGTTGTSMEVPRGDWVAQVGQSLDTNGRYDGQAVHRDADDQYWIAAPYEFTAELDAVVEHTFTLNFVVSGWWECCEEGGAVCVADEVDYSGGTIAHLPMFDVQVDGMSFSVGDQYGQVTGAFVDATRAEATIDPAEGAPFDVSCCESGPCD